MRGPVLTEQQKRDLADLPREEKIRRQENQNIEHMMRIHQRVEEVVQDKATAEALKPWYMHRCKRPCYDDEYLPAFNRPNVHLVDTNGKGITEVNERGVVFEGREYPVDVLIYATGFEVQVTGIYNEIRGENGLELNEKYADGMRTVFGIHSTGYPEPVHHGWLPGIVPVQPDVHAADPGRPHRRVHQLCPRAWPHHDRCRAGDGAMVGGRGDPQPRQDQPQQGMHARATTTSRARTTAGRTATTTAVSSSTSPT